MNQCTDKTLSKSFSSFVHVQTGFPNGLNIMKIFRFSSLRVFHHHLALFISTLHISTKSVHKTDIYYKMVQITRFDFHTPSNDINVRRKDPEPNCLSWSIKILKWLRQNCEPNKEKTNRKWRAIRITRRNINFPGNSICNENLCANKSDEWMDWKLYLKECN